MEAKNESKASNIANMFARCSKPHPSINRALVGPFCPRTSVEDHTAKHCLVVSRDKIFATLLKVDATQLRENPNAFWAQVGVALKNEFQTRPTHDRVSAPDCLALLSGAALWLPRPDELTLHPAVGALSHAFALSQFGTSELCFDEKLTADLHAQAEAESAIANGVLWTVGALYPEILDVIKKRPRLSVTLVGRIVKAAEPSGSDAIKFALQAIATESVGVLNMLAYGQPEMEAQILRTAVFSGKSLPAAFKEIGVTKSAHRSSLLRIPAFQTIDRVPDPARSLNDLPLDAQNFLMAMRLQTHMPLQGRQDWLDFTQLLSKFLHLQFEDDQDLKKRLFLWSLSGGRYSGCADRLERLLMRARSLVQVTHNLTGCRVSIESVLNELLLGGIGFGSQRTEDVIQLVIKFSGQKIEDVLRPVFDAHPGIPKGFCPTDTAGLAVKALDDVNALLAHGKASKNCLHQMDGIKGYLAHHAALYAVQLNGSAIGTIALEFSLSTSITASEVLGTSNKAVSQPVVELADELARSFVLPEYLFTWIEYAKRCDDFLKDLLPA